MEKHGVAIGLFRRNKEKEYIERIEYGGFKMGPERYSCKHIRVPERNGMVSVYFIIEELFERQIEAYKVAPKQVMLLNEDIFEKENRESRQGNKGKEIFFAKAKHSLHLETHILPNRNERKQIVFSDRLRYNIPKFVHLDQSELGGAELGSNKSN